MPTYTAYGLCIDSEIPLPELQSSDAAPDVYVETGTVSEIPDEPIEDGKLYRLANGHYLKVEGVGQLFAARGRKLVVNPTNNANPVLFRHFVLGDGFRALLYQRGYVVLHASATCVNGRTVAFVGDSGQGKSTTVAAFYAAGYPVLTDDVAAIEPKTGSLQPAFPRVKLDRQAAKAVGADFERPDGDEPFRQYYVAPRAFDAEPISLGAVYVLAEGSEVRIETLPPGEQPYRLMCESTSGYQHGEDRGVESHFTECVQLSEQVPVKRLERPRRFDVLSDVVRAVEADVAETDRSETTGSSHSK